LILDKYLFRLNEPPSIISLKEGGQQSEADPPSDMLDALHTTTLHYLKSLATKAITKAIIE